MEVPYVPGSSTARDWWALTITRFPMLPSVPITTSAPRTDFFSRLNSPARTCPCQRFTFASRQPAHDSGSSWFVIPSRYDSYIRSSMPWSALDKTNKADFSESMKIRNHTDGPGGGQRSGTNGRGGYCFVQARSVTGAGCRCSSVPRVTERRGHRRSHRRTAAVVLWPEREAAVSWGCRGGRECGRRHEGR